eukprot:m.732710 g.732710  ORF g.732710 m.732710 type:complete len:387 (-) comp23068_c0_seq22:1924-3084(-)
MSGLLVDYGSSSDSENDSSESRPQVASPPPDVREKNAAGSATLNVNNGGSTAVQQRKRRRLPKTKGPTLAEKRRLLMAAPEVVPDSDSDDDTAKDTPSRPTEETDTPKSFASLLPKPKNTRVSSTTIAAPAIAASTIQNQNMTTDKFMDTKAVLGAASRPLVPHVISKKAKSEQKPKFFSSAADDDTDSATTYVPSVVLPTVQSAPGAPSAAAPAPPAVGYGQPSPSCDSAPPEPPVHAGSFGYGRGPVAVEPAVATPAAVSTDARTTSGSAAVDIHSSEFQQLLGAQQRQQTKHGRKGDIKFVDVDQNTRVGSFEEWKLKHGHEQGPMAHNSTSSQTYKTNSLSKRKHQITWLALQAKERQQELENSWAASAQAKKAARQRYGFH